MPSWATRGTLPYYGIGPEAMEIDAALLPGGRSDSGAGGTVMIGSGLAGLVPGLGALQVGTQPTVADLVAAGVDPATAAQIAQQAATTDPFGRTMSQESAVNLMRAGFAVPGTTYLKARESALPWWGWVGLGVGALALGRMVL